MKRVLVIEDDTPIRELIIDLLESEGYAVSQAASGADGLRQLDLACPDAIVLDLMLPDMDGRRIAQLCHQRTFGAPVPILLVSASPGLWRAAEELRAFGVRGFMSKPFDLEIFLVAVEGLTAPAPLLATAG